VSAGDSVGARRTAARPGGAAMPNAASSDAHRATSARARAPALRDEVVFGLTPLEQQKPPEVALVRGR
jgi:hypothetical protein